MRRKLKTRGVVAFFLVVALLVSLLLSIGEANKGNNKIVEQMNMQTTSEILEQDDIINQSIDKYLSEMTVEEKIGQLFLVHAPVDDSQIDRILTVYKPAGLILFTANIEGEDLASLTSKLANWQTLSTYPLFIASDEEGGAVTRLSQLLETPFQAPMDLYDNGGIPAILEEAEYKIDTLKSVGINLGLFPNADLTTDRSAFIYTRTIGQDAETTADYISQLVGYLKKRQFGSTLKHFPGYGGNGDTHISLIYDTRTLDSFENNDFLPFKAGINAGADSVMVSHNIVSNIDDVPASISPAMTKILREDLGFDGVVMTDDFGMAGIAAFASQEEAAFQAILAGNDLIITSAYHEQIPYLLEKVASGDLTEERLDQSVRRIIKFKFDLGLFDVSYKSE